jgi:predicted O-methyltransferase YrrM
MNETSWGQVDQYLSDRLAPPDDALTAALAANAAAGLPAIDVSPLLGKFLDLMVRISGAKSVLEIGTLGGYSTIWMARALAPGGRVVTLEINPAHAATARTNLDRAGVGEIVTIRVGRAVESLTQLANESAGPFDLIFIDADKPSNPDYLAGALRLSRVGTVIICDNVVREGQVIDPANTDPAIVGTRRLIDLMAADPRLTPTAIQMVGGKGHDGFAIAVVTSPSPGTPGEGRGEGDLKFAATQRSESLSP